MTQSPSYDVCAVGNAIVDVLAPCEPAFLDAQGLVSGDIIRGLNAAGRRGEHIADRAAAGDRLVELAQAGDRILIMGARDDPLSEFAEQVLARV